jgi:AcrR family transcriptional regulator
MPRPKLAERSPLTRERVLGAALELADRDGLAALTMRRLADDLGVEAMSIYYHLPNKEAILDGLVEVVFGEIEHEVGGFPLTATPSSWKADLRERILAARRVLLRHPWVPVVMETRSTLGPTMARYTDAAVGIMRTGGVSFDLIHHSLHALGSRLYGFTQELRLDGDPSAEAASTASPDELELMLALAPNLAAMLEEVVHDEPDTTLGWCDDQTEFEFGLDILLDGIERRAHA